MPNLNSLAVIVSEISAFIRTDGHGWIDSASDPDQEHMIYSASDPDQEYIHTLWGRNATFWLHILVMGSEKLPSA